MKAEANSLIETNFIKAKLMKAAGNIQAEQFYLQEALGSTHSSNTPGETSESLKRLRNQVKRLRRNLHKARRPWLNRLDLTCLGLILLIFSVVKFVEWDFPNYTEGKESFDSFISLNSLTASTGAQFEPKALHLLGTVNGQEAILSAGSEYRVTTKGFHSFQGWSRNINFALHSSDDAEVVFKFPQNKATHVALYLTDGDSYWRTVRVVSGQQMKSAWGLHNGKWVTMKITPEEMVSGEKKLELYRLTGISIAISAATILYEKEG